MIGIKKLAIVKNNSGFTFLEIIVATLLYAIVMTAVVSVFQVAISGQASAVSAQSTQENLRFAMEIMSKEIRMAKSDTLGSSCDVSGNALHNKVYNTNSNSNEGEILYFKNKDDKCVVYSLEGGQIMISRDDGTETKLAITPNEIEITNLRFFISDNPGGTSKVVQPQVTIRMTAAMRQGKEIHKQPIDIQTTLSSRYYR